MCAQFGRWNFDGGATPVGYLEKVRQMFAACGPDGEARYRSPGFDLLYHSFETAELPSPELPPLVLPSGEVLTWEGRLDNRTELAADLNQRSSPSIRDLAIVAAAWERWGRHCLKRLTGDWALTVWSARDRTLLLAADILATRHLWYAIENNSARWSSVPDPLILLSERNLTLEEEYLAGWLASFPAAHLSPFREIHRVPPASTVVIRPGSVAVRPYWDFDGTRRIRYAGDGDYEEHFLDLFRQSVQRRLRSNSPVLAELSGGMDSSAIVCVADQLTAVSGGMKIDTVSWYNDSEPHWNERPWFTRVESHRGQTGLHVDANAVRSEPDLEGARFEFRPGASASTNPMLQFMIRRGHRVLLSGIGGDEFLGGVPTPLPELEDLLVCGKVPALWRRMLSWALVQRRPCIDLLHDTMRGFLPFPPGGGQRQIPWLLPDFVRRQLGSMDLPAGHPFERRYPFLDQDLLEFLFAIPREQLIRPGQRRSLMRRALRGVVPDAILDRRRKAFISRAPVRYLEQHLRQFDGSGPLACEKAGILDSVKYRSALSAACAGKGIPLMPLMRALAIEQWLQAPGPGGLLDRSLFLTQTRVSTGHSGGNQVPEFQEAGEAPPCRP